MSTGTDAWFEAARDTVPPRRLEKQIALASAACGVFGQEGYARAPVDGIAAAAGVSTRTLYNHFPEGKAQLFRTVVTWTSIQVRDAQLEMIHAMLPVDRPPHPEVLERDLAAMARAFGDLITRFPEHFALVRHIHAEAGHVPPEVLEAWRNAGPVPVRKALTEAMTGLEKAGLIDTHGDADMTASHFVALTSHDLVQRSNYGTRPLPDAESARVLQAGVAAFLRAYRVSG